MCITLTALTVLHKQVLSCFVLVWRMFLYFRPCSVLFLYRLVSRLIFFVPCTLYPPVSVMQSFSYALTKCSVLGLIQKCLFIFFAKMQNFAKCRVLWRNLVLAKIFIFAKIGQTFPFSPKSSNSFCKIQQFFFHSAARISSWLAQE